MLIHKGQEQATCNLGVQVLYSKLLSRWQQEFDTVAYTQINSPWGRTGSGAESNVYDLRKTGKRISNRNRISVTMQTLLPRTAVLALYVLSLGVFLSTRTSVCRCVCIENEIGKHSIAINAQR